MLDNLNIKRIYNNITNKIINKLIKMTTINLILYMSLTTISNLINILIIGSSMNYKLLINKYKSI